MSLDIEFNQPSQKIIQIGYVVGNIFSGEIVDRGTIFINPGETLNPYIIQLCSIKQEEVDAGVTVLDGYNQLVTVANKYDLPTNLITWGGGDAEALRKQAGLMDVKWRFGRRFTDVKTVMVSYCLANQKKMAGGLSKSMNKLGLSFTGTKHQAEDDAYNTFNIYVELLKRMKHAT